MSFAGASGFLNPILSLEDALGILSDTHDLLERTQYAVETLRAAGVEVLVHCGDITGPEIVAVRAVLPCYFTFGNHDADRVPELRHVGR